MRTTASATPAEFASCTPPSCPVRAVPGEHPRPDRDRGPNPDRCGQDPAHRHPVRRSRVDSRALAGRPGRRARARRNRPRAHPLDRAGPCGPVPAAKDGEPVSPMTTYTHPDVFGLGITEGWAEAETDPTRVDWPTRQG